MESAYGETVGDQGPAFGILGPMEAWGESGRVKLPSARQRVVLGALLLRPDRVVSLDEMVDSLWPERSPATARDQVVNVVSALRRLFGAGGRPATQWLVTQSPGYRARIGPGRLDVENFEALVRTAGAQFTAGCPSGPQRICVKHWDCGAVRPWPTCRHGSRPSRPGGWRNCASPRWRS